MKTSNLSADNFKKLLDFDWSTPEPMIRSSDTGRRIPSFDSCHNIEVQHVCIISCAPQTKIMDKSLGTLWGLSLPFWGVFQFTQVQPLPSPHKQCWICVSKIFSELQLCIGWGEGELQENFKKHALF